jgi:hypothetical protein
MQIDKHSSDGRKQKQNRDERFRKEPKKIEIIDPTIAVTLSPTELKQNPKRRIDRLKTGVDKEKERDNETAVITRRIRCELISEMGGD